MLSFGRRSAVDVLQSLRDKKAAYDLDPLNTELANACAIDAWSLCDWVFAEHGASLEVRNLSEMHRFMRNLCPSIDLIKDVANASKHRDITRYSPVLKEAKRHDGAFDRTAFDSDAFDVSALVLVREDNSEVWFDSVLDEVTACWVSLFRDRGWIA